MESAQAAGMWRGKVSSQDGLKYSSVDADR